MNENTKKNIENLINNIDEFNAKYITYRAQSLRTILVGALDYIGQKEQECEEINLTNERLIAEKYVMNEGILKYKQALDEIEKIANKQRKFDLTGKTPLAPAINEVGGDFIDILDIINEVKDN